jgi:hypothetical protein
VFRDEDRVDVAAKYGLEPFLRQWLEHSEDAWLPLCPEVWGSNRIPYDAEDVAQDVLASDCCLTEEALLAGDIDRAFEELEKYPQRCSETGVEELRDWAPGKYLHCLRRLVTGDSANVVHQELLRVEAALDEPVPYLELLRLQLTRHLEEQERSKDTRATPSDPIHPAPFPEWPTNLAWLLVGDPIEGDGFLAYGGQMIRGLPAQVFKLIFMMRERQPEYPVQEALKSRLIKPKSTSKPDGAFKKLIGRSNTFFYALGAGKEENPLRFSKGACLTTVWIRHVRETSRIPKLLSVTE